MTMNKRLLSTDKGTARASERAAMFLRAFLFDNPDAIEYCRKNDVPFVRANGERAHSVADNTTGGVFVITEVERAIIDLRVAYGVFRRNAKVMPMKSESKTVQRRKGGIKAYPVIPGGLGGRGKESKGLWNAIELFAEKWMVLTRMENELEEDSAAFVEELLSEMAYAFTYAEDDAGFNGSGTEAHQGIIGVIPKLRGIASDPANIKGIRVASGNSWGEITKADLLALVGLLPAFARREGQVKWYCSHEFWATVLLPVETIAGAAAYAEDDGELKPLFIGKPVEFVEVMPTVEAPSQIPLLYGNLAQAAVFGERRGVTIKKTESNGLEFEADIQTVKATERFAINVHDVGDTEKAGAIVGLMTASS